ncbi:uncharacterized protein E0L32_007403 [Thyridium curvatum]|uniref:Uncharacterized protein n=1 Tax=Thyridium curvatum TaxID=1093900 RepID=A0A507AMI3_9PEZI|nr:uncharacterized protein E0L32_007403 [Thyridium curvatum]TPX11905.1 hypothetical protein E0L32_007403 [Thyridium curvatum]
MDPLSVSASIIAIVQATVGVGKAVQYLRSIRNIPAEFLDLTNELTGLQAILAQVHAALVNIDGDDERATIQATGADSVALQNCKTDLEKLVQELDALCGRMKVSVKKETNKEGGAHERISKRRWTREREHLATLRNRTKRTCDYLNLAFVALQTSRSAQQAGQLAAVQQAMQRLTQMYQEGNHRVYTKCLDLENLVRLADSEYATIDRIHSVSRTSDTANDIVSFPALLTRTAIIWNRMDVADLLIGQGFDVELEDQYNCSPVSWSYQSELFGWIPRTPRDQVIQKQLAGLYKYTGSSPIHDAVLGVGSSTLATAISQDPGDLNKMNNLGMAPLHVAVLHGDAFSVASLLQHGAYADIRDRNFGFTPLQLACISLHSTQVEIARLLLAHGADPNIYGKSERTPLMLAIDDPEMVLLLLDHGAQVTERDGSQKDLLAPTCGHSPFPDTSKFRSSWKRSLEILMSTGIDLDIPCSVHNETPLLVSIGSRNTAFADVLIELGAALNAVDDRGRGILHIAAMTADAELIEVLRRAKIHGICPDAVDNHGHTPLRLIAGRMIDPEWVVRMTPGVRRPTQEEFYAFKDLVQEIRDRNRLLRLRVVGDQQAGRRQSLDDEQGGSERSFTTLEVAGGRSSINEFTGSDSILGCWTDSGEMAESDEDEFFDTRSHWSLGEN